MRKIERLPISETAKGFYLTDERRKLIQDWVETEYTFASSARAAYDNAMVENLRQYEGVPQRSVKQYPYEGAPNYEFNVSAIAVDSIHSQTIDLMFSISPAVKASASNKDHVNLEAPLQRLIDWGATNEWRLREAATSAFLNNIKHGSGVYYVPYEETIKRTDIRKVIERGPRIYSVPVEDFYVPGGVENLEEADWCGLRSFVPEGALVLYAAERGWNIDGAKAAPRHSKVRNVRERYGKTTSFSGRKGTVATYEVLKVYANIPIGGEDLDLLVYYDPNGHHIYKVTYMPYDRWPFEVMRYQPREHLIYGLGVVEMSRQFQNGVTDFMNNWLANSFLANMRGFKGPHGAIGSGDSIKMRPGKYYGFPMPDQVEIFQMADVYASGMAAVQTLLGFAERRTGVNDVTNPRPSSLLGNRTPGITALSVMQQANRRFVNAFDEMRIATQKAVRQCLYRYQERLLADDSDVRDHLYQLLGDYDGALVEGLLRDENFDNAMKVELSATDATQNRLQERQDAIALAGMLGQYYDKVVQLMQLAATQGVSEEMRSTALKVATATGEIIKRTVQTFDTIRDPERFVIDLEKEINAIPGVPEAGIESLLAMLGGAGGQGAGIPADLLASLGGGQPDGGAAVPGAGQGGGGNPVLSNGGQ
mgnify:FL=1